MHWRVYSSASAQVRPFRSAAVFFTAPLRLVLSSRTMVLLWLLQKVLYKKAIRFWGAVFTAQ